MQSTLRPRIIVPDDGSENADRAFKKQSIWQAVQDAVCYQDHKYAKIEGLTSNNDRAIAKDVPLSDVQARD